MKKLFLHFWQTTMPLLIVLAAFFLLPQAAIASPDNCIDIGTTTCTDNPCFHFDNNFLGKLGKLSGEAQGIMEQAINQVALSINKASMDLYNGITGGGILSFNFSFLDVVGALLTLYIIFYAVGLLFGFVQATLLDAFIRMFKIGLLLVLIEPSGALGSLGGFFGFDFLADGGWGFFSQYVVRFFNEGTNEIIMLMVNIAKGNPFAAFDFECAAYGQLATFGIPYNVGCPFKVLDQSVAIIFSPRMFITILGALSTPPYGIIIVVAIIVSIFTFFMVLIRAMQVYALSLVAKAILFGVAPIFIAFMLFERTRGLFVSWLGQVISYSLQPIVLFTFLSFFGLLIQSAASDLLPEKDVHLCYTKSSQQANTPIDIHAWTFGCRTTADGPIVPYTGKWTWDGAANKETCPDAYNKKFPIDPVKILIFLLLCYLMYKVSDVAVNVAQDLAGGMGTALNSGSEGLQGMISSAGGKGLVK